MEKVKLGKTGFVSIKNGFGALPIQRVSDEQAIKILKTAFESGITFYDTARFYTDSEHKLGLAFKDLRDEVIIASKTMAKTVDKFWEDLNTSLSELGFESIDLYQFHNPPFCPKPKDGSGLYEAMLEAKAQGKIKHIGISSHKLNVANEAIESGLYETLQFPFNFLSTENEFELIEKCKNANMGFIAMKGLSGGLITNSAAAFSFMLQYPSVLPIWGIQREKELAEFISYMEAPPEFTEEIKQYIKKERSELSGEFCRGCGYCMSSCPMGIDIATCARMSLLLRRSPSELQLNEAGQEKIAKAEQCINCGKCKELCPYSLDTPSLIKRNVEDYKRVLKGEIKV